MKYCKVKGCDRKYHSKGFCRRHYDRSKYIERGQLQVYIPLLMGKGKYRRVYTDGVTQEIKDSGFVAKETERILNDCIANPRKYLKDVKD